MQPYLRLRRGPHLRIPSQPNQHHRRSSAYRTRITVRSENPETQGWVLQSSVDYLLSEKKSVIELAVPLGTSRQLGRVTYTGGYIVPGVTPTGNQIALPDDIEQACIDQVAYWYQRRAQLGLVSVTSGDRKSTR